MLTIITVLFLNAISFIIVATLNKHMRIEEYSRGSDRITTYLICGTSNSKRLYEQLLLDDNPIMGTIKIMSFQNFGFNPKMAATQLKRDIEAVRASDSAPITKTLEGDTKRPIICVSTSLGAEVPLFVVDDEFRHIAVNPCFGRHSLQINDANSRQWIAVLLEFLVLLIGWIAYIPFFKYGKNRYSLALYADMFYWTLADVGAGNGICIDGLIINEDDKIIDSDWLFKNVSVYDRACISVVRGKYVEYIASITEIWHRIR